MDDFILDNIKIGFAEGAKEAEEENFTDIFYKGNNKYNELLQKYKFIISGRKGTGKTLLAKYYQKTMSDDLFIIDYSKFNNISLHEYIDLDTANVNEDIRILFQEYYIYKHIVITILDNKRTFKNFKKNNGLLNFFKDYFRYREYVGAYNDLEELYKSYYPDGPYNEKEIKTVKRVVESASMESNMGINEPVSFKNNSTNSNERSIEFIKEKKNFAERIAQFKKCIYKCLKYISVSIIIDELDEIRSNDTEHLIIFLLSLVVKINDINLDLLKINSKSKCILLLRSDILELFASRGPNIQKIITDSNIELEWFKNSDELEKMILYKIGKSDVSQSLKNYKIQSIRDTIFSKAPNTSETSFDRILRYSLGRPRDVITYINNIISAFPNENQITYQLVKETELTYSKNLFFEIKNEMELKKTPDEIADIEKLLRNFGQPTFTYQEILKYFEDHKKEYPYIIDIEATLQYLYELGLIGNFVVTKVKKRHNKKSAWSYRNGGPILNKDLKIAIHFGIRKALNIL